MALLSAAHRRCKGIARLLLTAGLWISPLAGSHGEELPLARAVEAAYLYKLAPFIDWPPRAFGPSSTAFSICVAGPDPFGSLLDRVVAGQRIGDRPIVIRRMPDVDPNADCQIIYLGGASGKVKDGFRALRGAPILTVTDNEAAPGMVDFVVDQGRVRFRIDDAAAAAADLNISSKLLSLALSVKSKTAAGARP